MTFPDSSQQHSEESTTIKIGKLIKNRIIAKSILAIALATALGIFYAKDATSKYEKGQQLTQEKYIKDFDRYKNSLMNGNAPQHPAASIFVSLMLMSFLIGSYELAALAISLIIGKVLRS
jgi:hypothetical protein